MDYIKEQMINKSLQLGAKMPSVKEFSAELGVNPVTVQRAYKELEDENILVSQRGIGSFITQEGSVIGLLGECGIGKITIMKIISGIIDSYQGQVLINGQAVNENTKSIVLGSSIDSIYLKKLEKEMIKV